MKDDYYLKELESFFSVNEQSKKKVKTKTPVTEYPLSDSDEEAATPESI